MTSLFSGAAAGEAAGAGVGVGAGPETIVVVRSDVPRRINISEIPPAQRTKLVHRFIEEEKNDLLNDLLNAMDDGERIARVNAKNPENGNSSLMKALLRKDVDIETIEILLKAGANPHIANNTGLTPALLAELKGLTEVSALLGPSTIEPKVKNNVIYRSLCSFVESADNHNLGSMIIGIDYKIRHKLINSVSKEDGNNLLMKAMLRKGDINIDTLKLLLAADVSPNTRNRGGHTPVSQALFHGVQQVVDVLKTSGKCSIKELRGEYRTEGFKPLDLAIKSFKETQDDEKLRMFTRAPGFRERISKELRANLLTLRTYHPKPPLKEDGTLRDDVSNRIAAIINNINVYASLGADIPTPRIPIPRKDAYTEVLKVLKEKSIVARKKEFEEDKAHFFEKHGHGRSFSCSRSTDAFAPVAGGGSAGAATGVGAAAGGGSAGAATGVGAAAGGGSAGSATGVGAAAAGGSAGAATEAGVAAGDLTVTIVPGDVDTPMGTHAAQLGSRRTSYTATAIRGDGPIVGL